MNVTFTNLPCDICGAPSVSVMTINREFGTPVTQSRCREHLGPTAPEMIDALRRELAASTAREERLREALVYACPFLEDAAEPDRWLTHPAPDVERVRQIRAVLAETAAREGQGGE